MTTAEFIFSSISVESDIDNLVTEKATERLYFELKRKRNPGTISIDEDVKVNLAKTISAFANTDGGVLVFGIDAPSKGNYAKLPIENIVGFRQEVEKFLSRCTSRPVPGVITKAIQLVNGSGYLAILVPASDEGPHRAEPEGHYYFRNGDSTLKMSHSHIADSFGRRHHPKLEAYSIIRLNGIPGELEMVIGLQNIGRALAKYPMLVLSHVENCKPNQLGIDGSGNFGLPMIGRGFKDFRGGANEAVHAGTRLPVCRYTAYFNVSERSDAFQDLNFEGELAADGYPLRKFSLKFPKKDIEEIFRRSKQQAEITEQVRS